VKDLDNVLVPNPDKGANRGVGFELATRFLAMGYSVHGTYRHETHDDPSVQQVESIITTYLHKLILCRKAQRVWREDL
jgi:NAD(P)-dependent dehydrogenase (short-subunit alcohol dehydrogenase family)